MHNVKVHIPECDRIIVIETVRRIAEAIPPMAAEADDMCSMLAAFFDELEMGIHFDPRIYAPMFAAGAGMAGAMRQSLEKEFERD